jgi:hypothetical protein
MVTTASLKTDSDNKQNKYNILFKHLINFLNVYPVKDTLYYLNDEFLGKNMLR